jgi:integrase
VKAEKRRQTTGPTVADIRTMLDVTNSASEAKTRDYAIVLTFYCLGLRVSELCGLNLQDSDLARGSTGSRARDAGSANCVTSLAQMPVQMGPPTSEILKSPRPPNRHRRTQFSNWSSRTRGGRCSRPSMIRRSRLTTLPVSSVCAT